MNETSSAILPDAGEAEVVNGVWFARPGDELKTTGQGRSEGDLAQRRKLAAQMAAIAEEQGWTKSEAARRCGMPDGTFSQWWSGKYSGRLDTTNKKVEQFLSSWSDMRAKAESLPEPPGFIRTSISDQITDMLMSAQVLHGLVMVSVEAGLGKTMTARQYQATRPNVFLATMSPYANKPYGMMQEVARATGVQETNPAKLVTGIGRRLAVSGQSLLIVDEAQNLSDEAINQLRHFSDEYQCGVALLGNTETYSRFSGWKDGPKYAQLRSRIFKRMRKDQASIADLRIFIAAHGITDKGQVEFLTGVGKKGGAMRQVSFTVMLAKMTAMGAGRELTLEDLKAANHNRDVEA